MQAAKKRLRDAAAARGARMSLQERTEQDALAKDIEEIQEYTANLNEARALLESLEARTDDEWRTEADKAYETQLAAHNSTADEMRSEIIACRGELEVLLRWERHGQDEHFLGVLDYAIKDGEREIGELERNLKVYESTAPTPWDDVTVYKKGVLEGARQNVARWTGLIRRESHMQNRRKWLKTHKEISED